MRAKNRYLEARKTLLEQERVQRVSDDRVRKLLLIEIATELGFNEKYIVRYKWDIHELKAQVIGAIRERAVRIVRLTERIEKLLREKEIDRQLLMDYSREILAAPKDNQEKEKNG